MNSSQNELNTSDCSGKFLNFHLGTKNFHSPLKYDFFVVFISYTNLEWTIVLRNNLIYLQILSLFNILHYLLVSQKI